MVPLVPVMTASQLSLEVTEQVHTAILFLENLRTITVVPSTPRTKIVGVRNVIEKQKINHFKKKILQKKKKKNFNHCPNVVLWLE